MLKSHLKNMLEFANENPDHKDEIIRDTVDLVLLKEIDIPQEIYEYVLEAISNHELEMEEKLGQVLEVIEKNLHCQLPIKVKPLSCLLVLLLSLVTS